jgi:uncharacterized protein YkwD
VKKLRRTLSLVSGVVLAFGIVTHGTGNVSAAGPRLATNASCGSVKLCAQAALQIVNADRAHYHLAPIQLTMVQTTGRGSCIGSFGHSVDMARSGQIWHENTKFPQASFPNNICLRYHWIAENVGMAAYGNTPQDLQVINQMMMDEPHDKATCASTVNHACNILNRTYHKIGIGLVYQNGTTWLTEDFIG